jgi:glycosyltransferase involved in cell wall biosynthesis
MASRSKIVINHLMEPANRITGITRFLFALLSELALNQAYEYVLLTTWDAKRLPNAIRQSRVRVLARPFYNSIPINVIMQMVTMPRLIRELDASIEFNPNPIGCFWRFWPRVVTVHDLYFNLDPQRYSRRHRLWWNVLFPLSLAGSSEVICVSKNTLGDLHRYYPKYARKASVVHEASALADEEGEDATIASKTLVKPYALYVGNISPNKNPKMLAKALQILEAKKRPLAVYHVGRDDVRLLAEAVKEAGLARPVQTIGHLSDAALAKAYSDAECLITTSTYEGFCLPVLEAQKLGTAVVCSDIPVLREVAGDGALFFDAHDPAALAHALERIIDDTELRCKLDAAARLNASLFSWRRAANELERVFERVIQYRSDNKFD